MSSRKKIIILMVLSLFSPLVNPLFCNGRSDSNADNVKVSSNPSVEESSHIKQKLGIDEELFLEEDADDESGESLEDRLFFAAITELDEAFLNRDEKLFSQILVKYSKTTIYPLIEDYSKKQINRLIIDNEFSFVLPALYFIIDTNIDAGLDDNEAIEMYYTIYETYALQKK